MLPAVIRSYKRVHERTFAEAKNEAYEASEIHVRLTAAQAADRGEVAEAVLQAAQALLRKDDELVKKKQLYIKVRLA